MKKRNGRVNRGWERTESKAKARRKQVREQARRFADVRRRAIHPKACSRSIRYEVENGLPAAHRLITFGGEMVRGFLCGDCGAACSHVGARFTQQDLQAERDFGTALLARVEQDEKAFPVTRRCAGGEASLAEQLRGGEVIHPPVFLEEYVCGQEFDVACYACGVEVHGDGIPPSQRVLIVHGTVEERDQEAEKLRRLHASADRRENGALG